MADAGAAPDRRPEDSTAREDAPAPLPRKRWAAVAGLLLIEYLALSVSYDASALAHYLAWLHVAGAVGPVVVAVAAAVIAFGRVSAVDARRIGEACWPLPRLPIAGAAHALGVAALFVLSRRVLGAGAVPDGVSVIAWAASALAVVATAVAMAVPRRAFGALARVAARPLLVGTTIGGLAFAAGTASEALWGPLAGITFRATAALLHAAGVEDLYVDVATRQLGVGDFAVEVAGVCSGAQGLGMMAVFIVAYLVQLRATLRFPHALALLPVALLATYAANVVRIALLMWVGASVSESVAFGGFHSKAGWVLNAGVALALLVWARRSRHFTRAPRADAGENPTAWYLAPLMIAVAGALLGGLFGVGFQTLYPARALAAGLALVAVAPRLAPRPRSWPPSALPLVVGAAVLVVWIAFARPGGDEQVAELRASLDAMPAAGRAAWLAARAVGAVIMAVVEELAFRGFLLRRLVAAEFWVVDYRRAGRGVWAVACSSLAFGALHTGAVVPATIAGVAYAATAAVRGRLTDAIVAHACTNALLITWSIAFARWSWLA